MALATWWRSDVVPLLPELPGFHAAIDDDNAMLAKLNHLPIEEVCARRQEGHRPYVARLHGVPVAYGWVATRTASIGELKVTITLPRTDRYLWDFATLPVFQGRGLYPRLLQAILRQEAEADRLWIIYAPENLPSGAGMRKAGFVAATELSFDAGGQVRLATLGAHERARAAAELLGVPLVEDQLAPCWCCQAKAASDAAGEACWPPTKRTIASCTCAIERKPTAYLAT